MARTPPEPPPIRIGPYVLIPDAAEGSTLVFRAADGELVASLTRDEIERLIPKRSGPGHPADPSRELANDADLAYAGGEEQLLDRMDERNLRRRIELAAKRGLIDRKTQKLTKKGRALVTVYHVVDNPLTSDPRSLPQDPLSVSLVERSVVAKFDARQRPPKAKTKKARTGTTAARSSRRAPRR